MNVTILPDGRQEFNGKIYKLQGKYMERGGKRLHRVVWYYHNGTIPDGYHIHHKDHDRLNNQITNLECVPKEQHLREHMTAERRAWASKNVVENAMPAAKAWHSTEEGKEFHKQIGKKSWESKVWHTKVCTVCEKQYRTPFPERSKYCGNVCKARAFRAKHRKA